MTNQHNKRLFLACVAGFLRENKAKAGRVTGVGKGWKKGGPHGKWEWEPVSQRLSGLVAMQTPVTGTALLCPVARAGPPRVCLLAA